LSVNTVNHDVSLSSIHWTSSNHQDGSPVGIGRSEKRA